MFTIKPFTMNDQNQIVYSGDMKAGSLPEVYATAEQVDTAEVFYGDEKAGVIFLGSVAWTANFYNTHPEIVEFEEANVS